jgi:hypothetical protein
MRIFVGGLPRTATKDDLVRLFAQFGVGDDNVVLPRDRRTRRRKGIAYIEIADAVRARAAIEIFAGFAIDGKPLTICPADERPLKRVRRKLSIILAVCAATLAAALPACADETGLDIGLTLNPIVGGVHQSFDDRIHVPPIPIPLVEMRYRTGPFELDLEGLPPLGTVHADDAVQGPVGTQLTIFDGIARVWDPLHRYSAGIGQTLYNQSTHYADSVEVRGISETQFSRVTGITYELGYGIPLRRGRFEAALHYAPAMLGTQYSIYQIASIRRRADPERADQLDAALRFVRPAGANGEMILGLRYVNYTARYVEIGGGGLSDRNVGVLPVIGYRIRIIR